ncbi:MAG: 4-hydroxy-3-methylbut-2-enyl diphosphate reductase [Candidatus Kapabacteria bacterium]|nr:4-hydroxy-3-methylbut-2-enyl diphosphate reductase [Candidatus Kapabacteria bacterium]
MIVSIDNHSGFCWGVVRTVQIAEDQLAASRANRNVYVLGHIIHNPKETQRLQDKGLNTISVKDFPRLAHSGAKVIIRAHGEPPETYRLAWEHGIEIVDATCPVVTKLQERVRKFWDQGYQVVVFGKKDHAEVLGVRGVVHDQCVVVTSVEEANALVEMGRKTVLFSQTTMDRPTFIAVRDALKTRIAELVVDTMEDIATEFHAKDTICGQVSGREGQLSKFAAANDVILFVAGHESSNGKVLYNVAKIANQKTYFIENTDELNPEWLVGAETVGISGATSTPQWYMEEVKKYVETMKSNA